MYENQTLKTIEQILDNYVAEDYKIFKETIDELFQKGIPKGCFQDYAILIDILAILIVCQSIIKNKPDTTP